MENRLVDRNIGERRSKCQNTHLWAKYAPTRNFHLAFQIRKYSYVNLARKRRGIYYSLTPPNKLIMVCFVSNLCVAVISGEQNNGARGRPITYCDETRRINCHTRPIWSSSVLFISLLLHCSQGHQRSYTPRIIYSYQYRIGHLSNYIHQKLQHLANFSNCLNAYVLVLCF